MHSNSTERNIWQRRKKTDTEIPAMNNTEVVANCDHLLTITPIEDMIITLRGVQVIVDRDLATLYGVETKALNQAVRRNLNRFPSRFRFQLTKEEVNEVVTKCDHPFNKMEMTAKELLGNVK